MSRWIYIDDAIEIVTKIQGMRATTLHALCDAPYIDIVRCGECKHWQDNNGGYPTTECRWGHDETPDADDFCSYGCRKEE